MKYNEILRLKEMLEKESIPFDFAEMNGGYQICYPKKGENRICSIIEYDGSYGRTEDLLEIMGLLTDKELENDSVVGYLTAEEVFGRIKNHYESEVLK